jgi:hypothetical protein
MACGCSKPGESAGYGGPSLDVEYAFAWEFFRHYFDETTVVL